MSKIFGECLHFPLLAYVIGIKVSLHPLNQSDPELKRIKILTHVSALSLAPVVFSFLVAWLSLLRYVGITKLPRNELYFVR